MTAKKKPSNISSLNRCMHPHPSGRRCRLARSAQSSFYCSRHIHFPPPADGPVDLSSDLTADTAKFTEATDINRCLGKLFLMLAQDRIPPRRGAVLAYTGYLLLHSLNAMDRQREARDREEQEEHEAKNRQAFVWELPSPNRGGGESDIPIVQYIGRDPQGDGEVITDYPSSLAKTLETLRDQSA